MRCRLGDLAMIVASSHESNIGKIVFVEREAIVADWFCITQGSPLLTWRGIESLVLVIDDCDLRPIRPGDLDESTTNEKELTCQPLKPVPATV